MRTATRSRETAESAVTVHIALDSAGPALVDTGFAMLDHLLTQFGFHADCTLKVACKSRDRIAHHAIEDVAIVLGSALEEALADRAEIARFGEATIPMDDALVRCTLDLSGRGYARVELPLCQGRIEDLDACMVPHFFSTFATNARLTLHVDKLAGSDPHHIVEAAFKALGRSGATAWALRGNGIPSTKGVL